jgi:hypothetical protein
MRESRSARPVTMMIGMGKVSCRDFSTLATSKPDIPGK